jgi:hypothetical protein
MQRVSGAKILRLFAPETKLFEVLFADRDGAILMRHRSGRMGIMTTVP